MTLVPFAKAICLFERRRDSFEYLNIETDETTRNYYNKITAKHDASKVTPVTVIGERVLLALTDQRRLVKVSREAIRKLIILI